jgi:hypothetical protein
MSTYWHYECADHDPPLTSAEFTQHTDDDAYRFGVTLATSRPLDHAWWDGDLSGASGYFERNARSFLEQHPRCRLALVNEYGERRPLRPAAEPSVQPPTREQIAAEVKRVTHAWGGPAMDEFKNDPPIRKHYAIADAVLALFPQPTPSSEPDADKAETYRQGWVAGHAAPQVTGVKGDAAPPSIADMAPGTTFRGEMVGHWVVLSTVDGHLNVRHSVEDIAYVDIDPSTIRDVTPPPATPEEDDRE